VIKGVLTYRDERNRSEGNTAISYWHWAEVFP